MAGTPAPASAATPYVPRFKRTRWYRRADAPRTVFLYLCFALFVVWTLAPIAFTVQSSFSNPGEMTAQPPHWVPQNPTLQNYVSVFTSATDKSGQYTSEQVAGCGAPCSTAP
jgi:ABC-type glycerol-3-phosphate transport system permease component